MQEIINTLNSFGLSDNFIIDGNIHRCSSAAKPKKNKDGWYAIKEFNGQYYCNYGCWVRGEQGRCSTLNGTGTTNHKMWEALEYARIKEFEEREKSGQERALKFISKAIESVEHHPYLQKKQISKYKTLRINNLIVIPLYNPCGVINSYQTINNNGRKQFMTGGVVGGCCYPIKGDDSIICICEGFATGVSINLATGFKTLCAMNAGNIEKVAKSAIEKFKNSKIIICADNDHKKEKNVGIETGKKVAFELGLSCVWPTGINGSDFNDMAVEIGLNAVRHEISQLETIEVMSIEDCMFEDFSTQIPNGAIVEGLISQGLEALEGDILQYSLPLVLTVISRSIAGKTSLNGVYPNVFNIKVGGTSTGKTATDRKFLRCLDIENFISLNDIASGAGLWRAISENPQGMGFFDEVTSLFQRNNNKGGVDMVAESKSAALLDVFSRSGESFKKGFGDSKNSIDIHNPCFSLIGNATPVIFDAIQLKDFETGLMQRFDFWVYDGEIKPKPLLINSSYYPKTKKFVNELRQRIQFVPPESTLAELIKGCVELQVDDKALIYIKEYSDYITTEANKAQSDGLTGFISRRFDLCLKYALIHHAATNKAKKLLSKITGKDIQYGILIAEMLGGWKSNVLSDKIVSGDFHRDCETFKAAIKMAIRAGRTPTFAYMATRKTQLKNWPQKHSESVIGVLKKRGEIITKEGERSTQYHLPKKTNL